MSKERQQEALREALAIAKTRISKPRPIQLGPEFNSDPNHRGGGSYIGPNEVEPGPNDCEDCGESPEDGGFKRRTKCAHCGKLVCPWCMGHVHGRLHRATKKAQGG